MVRSFPGIRKLAKGAGAAAAALGFIVLSAGGQGVFAVSSDDPALPAPPPGAAPPGLSDKDGNRIADGLERRLEGMATGAKAKVIVTMAPGRGPEAAQAAAGPFEVGRRFSIINGFSATMTRAQVEALARAPGVVRIEEDIEVKAFLQDAKAAFGVDRVHAGTGEGLALDYDGSGYGICVIDTGIEASHSDLAGKVQGFCDATTGGCFEGDSGVTAYDDHGHGTHVASIAAGHSGVAPGADLWGAKVMVPTGDGNATGTSTDIIAGIEWCAAQPGVHIHNLSLGSSGPSDGSDAMSQAAHNAAVTKLVSLAAGNSGPAQLQIGAPAAAENPVTVGAVADWLSPVGVWRKGLAVFSSRGPTSDNRIKPDILAPGVTITAAKLGGGTVAFSGTSMSAPFVAGVGAMMLQADPGLYSSPPNPGGVSASVKEILAATAITRGDSSLIVDGFPKNYDYGWGEIDAFAAVAEAEGAGSYDPTPFPVELYQNPTIADGTVWDYEFEITDPDTQISANVYNGGVWTVVYLFETWWATDMGQDFDAWLYAPDGTLVDESTCEVDSDTRCGVIGRQETLVADPADFGGALPLGTWRLRVEPWDDTDGLAEEIIDVVITMGPVGAGEVVPPANDPPTAGFGFTTAGLTANFTDASTDSDGSIVGWSWDFGDGNASTAQNPSHSYSAGGTYTVTLTVTDNEGATDSASQDVTVSEPTAEPEPLVAQFTWSPSPAGVGDTVILTANAQDGATYDWSITWPGGWKNDPGLQEDGSETATFTPLKSGDYTVTLVVSREGEPDATASATIAVGSGDGGDDGGGGGKPCNPNSPKCTGS